MEAVVYGSLYRINSFAIATVLQPIIRTSLGIYWHSMSLRRVNSFVYKLAPVVNRGPNALDC